VQVLSVIAQQLMQLRQGMVQQLSVIEFEGRMIKLNEHCVIVTMNPGYAGRTELPDNLKVRVGASVPFCVPLPCVLSFQH
jgi:dynein heavy chain